MNSYFGVLTPIESTTLEIVTDFFVKITNTYVIAYETDANRPHYHFALWDTAIIPETLRAQIKKQFPGRVYLSGKEIQDKVHAIAYLFKEGNYKFNNINVNDFLMAQVITHKKVKYDNLLIDIEKDYLSGLIDDKQLVTKILDAYIKTNRKVYIQHIKSQALLIKLKKETNKDKKQLLIDRILDEL